MTTTGVIGMKKPLIGIMVTKIAAAKRDYIKAETLQVDILLFSYNGINWKEKKIKGHFLSGGRWQKKTCPFPSAIYYRRYAANDYLVKQLEMITGKGKVFNCVTQFDKSIIHNLLKTSAVSPYLPDTYPYQKAQLLELLSKYRRLILKPCLGYLGRRVYLLEQTEDNQYRLYENIYRNISQDQSLNKETPADNTEANFLKKLFSNNQNLFVPAKINTDNAQHFTDKVDQLVGHSRFLLQQFVPFDEIDHKIYDIRMYVQKNGNGNWTVSGGFSRIGNANSYVSNLCTEIKDYHGIVTGNTKLGFHQLNKMRSISLNTAYALENKLGHLGEMCVDFGLDKHGKPWIIEVNGRPQKKMVKRLNDKELINAVYLKPIEYARFLATKKPATRFKEFNSFDATTLRNASPAQKQGLLKTWYKNTWRNK
ncbi:YheC/YheD family protein [Thalassobacillus sp. C254]|uniref:YheC/YheD family endospore coat-associated protein n=1 Tax=Thalassobacillus sp. C254 TaxID=1225341 RepID=UPI0022B66AC9|nr:YheC/YheD family protein [Thalassobacillus sp. C254]